MRTLIRHLYRFGSYELQPAERLLFYEGHPVGLTPKAFDLLVFLVERSGHLCQKEELMRALWPDSFVEEGNLAVTVSLLRKALGDERGHQQYIETVSKSGYRFIAPVENLEDHTEVGPPQVENAIEKDPPQAVGAPSAADVSLHVL
jgi:DNA-binding winged helix-turn-helix (wHTH) protein